MEPRNVVYALAAAWLVLFATSFITLELGQQGGSASAQMLNRIATFLTWQGIALVAAVMLAFVTQRAVARGVEKVKFAGYAPLALSTFVVVSFIAIVAYRVFVAPLVA
jgi:hypothetical protein